MNDKKNIAIGVLAYNEENFIEQVLVQLAELNTSIYVINDKSTDSTLKILNRISKEQKNITVIENSKNFGAGYSTLKLLKRIKDDGYQYMIKVDGDGQFNFKDIKRIKEILTSGKYDFIKCNRFWSNGIEGKIPHKRYFGNLLATMMLQFTAGTNRLYDPLNGLFAISVRFLNLINQNKYPMRYGYPFYFSAQSAISNFRIYQINNIISYNNQKSDLSSIKMLLTLTRLVFYFQKVKIRNKLYIGKHQRSAFLDILFNVFLIITTVVFFRFILIFTPLQYFDTSYIGSWALILLVLGIFTIFIFIQSFKEEKEIRREYIKIDE